MDCKDEVNVLISNSAAIDTLTSEGQELLLRNGYLPTLSVYATVSKAAVELADAHCFQDPLDSVVDEV